MKTPGGGGGGASLLFEAPAAHRDLFRDAVYTHDAWRQHRSSAWRHRPEPSKCLAVAAGFWVELAYVAGLATALGLYETLAVGRGGAPSVALARAAALVLQRVPHCLRPHLHAPAELRPLLLRGAARALQKQECRRLCSQATAARLAPPPPPPHARAGRRASTPPSA